MTNILGNNAYYVLGLDTAVSQKDILKRSKEIINRLEIDEVPIYNLDFVLFGNFRTKETVKEALQKLQMPKKRIREYFFWFQIVDEVDEQAFKLIKTRNYKKAIHVWEVVSEGESVQAYLYKKNLAILYLLLLVIEDNEKYLQNSLSLWKLLIDSEKFWISFAKIYNLHDEQTASEGIITNFRKLVADYLSDIYTELYQIHKNKDYISQFQKVFLVKGERTEKDILGPAYRAIDAAIKKLENMKVSKDGVLDKQEKKTIKKLIELIKTELNNLIDLGLYDDSQTRVMRDKVGSALRSLSLDLNNNLDETEIALGLAKIAEEISGMESSKSKIQVDVATLKGNLEYKTKFEPILKEIKSGNAEEALQEINYLLADTDTNMELKKILQGLKKSMEERISKHGKPISNAPSMHTMNGVGTKVYGDTLYFVFFFIPIFPIARYSLEDHHDGSYSFFGKLELYKWQKYWQYITIGIAGIWILSLMLSG